MASRLPSLNALKAFESAARLGGIGRAAVELFVTESAVSRQIKALEMELGADLFMRNHRGVALTVEGAALAKTLTEAFGTIRRGVDQVRAEPGLVTLRTPPTLGTRWLLPRLRRFEADNPDLTVRVSVLWACARPEDMDFDLAVVFRGDGWPEGELIPLLSERLMPVCSPGYREKLGEVRSAEDLSAALLLHCAGSQDWLWWSRAWNRGALDCSRGEVFDTMDMVLRAAETGRGVGIADIGMIEDDLALGRLVPLVPFLSAGPDDLFLARRDRIRPRKAVSRLVEWLLEEARASTRSSGIQVERLVSRAGPRSGRSVPA